MAHTAPQYPQLDALIDKFGISATASKLRKPNGDPYSYSYVHQAHARKISPGSPFLKSVCKLHRQTFEDPPPPPKPRITITFEPGQEWMSDYAKSLTMKQRRQAIMDHFHKWDK